jgi:rhodanese-related sulfurtransferase
MSAAGLTHNGTSQKVSFISKTTSRVLEVSPAASTDAFKHFSKKLEFETDCSDVFASYASSTVDFVLVDVRSQQLFKKSRVPGAINIPVLNLTEDRLKEYPAETVFVVYCAGPHCNGANKAAIRISKLGRPVKEMIGGVTGWTDEGFSLVEGGS